MGVINFYGGPGSGKSTLAAYTFAKMKMAGLKVELVTEYAKDLTYASSFKTLGVQTHVFGEQLRRMRMVEDSVDCIVTDSPLLMSLAYGEQTDLFKDYVYSEYKSFNNNDVFVSRPLTYMQYGRTQTLTEATEKDEEIRNILVSRDVIFDVVSKDFNDIDGLLQRKGILCNGQV